VLCRRAADSRQGAPLTWVADLRQIQPHPKAGAMGQLVELNAGVEADSARSLQILRVERRDAPFAVERAMSAQVLDDSGSLFA
jgi:hypothetical protein